RGPGVAGTSSITSRAARTSRSARIATRRPGNGSTRTTPPGRSEMATKTRVAKQKTTLRRRIRRFYQWFNAEHWERCFECIDPRLRDEGRVEYDTYSASLAEFVKRYSKVELVFVQATVHQRIKGNPKADRPFAYVIVL